jgi:uncharacterized protein
MQYWDTSAVVPLVVAEAATDRVRALAQRDAAIVTWAWTRVEVVSAIERRSREGRLTAQRRREALAAFGKLFDAWDEVTDLLAVRARAVTLLARHSLRAADAAQLAAALLVSEEDPSFTFVCLDERLADAAEREGLRLP